MLFTKKLRPSEIPSLVAKNLKTVQSFTVLWYDLIVATKAFKCYIKTLVNMFISLCHHTSSYLINTWLFIQLHC